MKPYHWRNTLRQVIGGDDFSQEKKFLQGALQNLRLESSDTDGFRCVEFKRYMQSFAYSLHKYGYLNGVVNLVVVDDTAVEPLADFFKAYYEFIGKKATVRNCGHECALMRDSWDSKKDFAETRNPLMVLTDTGKSMGKYPDLVALQQIVGVSEGIILISNKPLTHYGKVYSKDCTSSLDHSDIVGMEEVNYIEYIGG